MSGRGEPSGRRIVAAPVVHGNEIETVDCQLTDSSCTSKTRVALAGITPDTPVLP